MSRRAFRKIEVDPLFKEYIDELKLESALRGQKRSDIEITLMLRDILKGMPIKEALHQNGNGKKKNEYKEIIENKYW